MTKHRSGALERLASAIARKESSGDCSIQNMPLTETPTEKRAREEIEYTSQCGPVVIKPLYEPIAPGKTLNREFPYMRVASGALWLNNLAVALWKEFPEWVMISSATFTEGPVLVIEKTMDTNPLAFRAAIILGGTARIGGKGLVRKLKARGFDGIFPVKLDPKSRIITVRGLGK